MRADLPSEVAGSGELATLTRRSDGYTEKGCAAEEHSRRTTGDNAPYSCLMLVYINETVAACNGGGGPLGHPRVYLNLEPGGKIECPYCSRIFVNRAMNDSSVASSGKLSTDHSTAEGPVKNGSGDNAIPVARNTGVSTTDNVSATEASAARTVKEKMRRNKWGIVIGSCLMVLPLAASELYIIQIGGWREKEKVKIQDLREEFSKKNLSYARAMLETDISEIRFSIMSDRAVHQLSEEQARDVHNAYLTVWASQLYAITLQLNELDPLPFLQKKLDSLKDKVASGIASNKYDQISEGIGGFYFLIAEKVKERANRLASIIEQESGLQSTIDLLEDRIALVRRTASILQIVGLLVLIWFEYLTMDLIHPHQSSE